MIPRTVAHEVQFCPNMFINNNYLSRPIAKILLRKYVEERRHFTTFIFKRYFKVFRLSNSIRHSEIQQAGVIKMLKNFVAFCGK
jgi:hypothetical protein